MVIDILYFIAVLGAMTALAVPMGMYLARTFTGTRHLLPERLTYRLFGIDPDVEAGWQGYALGLVLSNAAMMLLGYLLLRFQLFLPLNPLDLAPQSPDLAFNTAASFITNTNWQSYSGETLSNFSQMAVITFLMFVGAATGVAAAAAFIRALSRKSADTIGNFWVDLTRVIYRVFLPICFVLALVFIWQGMPQILDSVVTAMTLGGGEQAIRIGPVASLETIKHIGTNGGGFFGMNAAHPYENPTPLTNVLHILSMLLIPSALTYAFGSMLLRRRQGWAFFAAFMVMFVSSLAITYSAEQYGNPLLAAVGV
ncbi:MAG: potassium-transporting ATPase subunit KdpA, partial [Salinisphaera sp.]|nr:potassium-transporting ATPase subunit KdpA [Salinisphaera sp.]